MRVAINALWRATSPSGICRHAAALARCLCLRSEVESVYLFIGRWQEHYFTHLLPFNHSKLVVRPFEITNNSYTRNRWYLDGFPRATQTLGAHIIHTAFPAPLTRGQLRPPIVTTLHDLYPYDTPANFGFPRVLGHRMLLRQCLRKSDHIACVSDFTLGRLAALFGSEMAIKATRIYNCVERSHVRERHPVLLNLRGRPFLLSVAQHRKNKNIDLLLEGFAVMLSESVLSKETILLVVGSVGPETPQIMRIIAKLALNDHVILAHSMTEAELVWLYKHALLVICTSSVEGFGLPLAEAAQYGARVVCSDIPAFREIGRNNCTFFGLPEANSIYSFVQACRYALQQPPPPMAHSSQFSSDEIGSQYMDVYSRLLQSRLADAA